MSDWTTTELDDLASDDELQISSKRADGSDRPFVTIWAVRLGDTAYVRSAFGTGNPWYRRALAAGRGRVSVGSLEREVAFTRLDPGDALQSEIDALYHAKYDRYGASIVDPVVGPTAHLATLRLDPV